jgi:hypothetical protein
MGKRRKNVPELLPDLLARLSTLDHQRRSDTVRNTHTRRSRTENNNPRVLQFALRDVDGGDQGGENNGGGTLHVVVEAGLLGAVLLQEAGGIGDTEVFEVEEGTEEGRIDSCEGSEGGVEKRRSLSVCYPRKEERTRKDVLRVLLANDVAELVDELVVSLAANTFPAHTEVERVVKEGGLYVVKMERREGGKRVFRRR